ncbi:hypothetical protein SNE40_016922 [Patella caerulea]
MNITSNVTEVSLGDSYSVTCRSRYHPVDFYRNNRKRVSIDRSRYAGTPCMVNNTDGFYCTITYLKYNKTYDHQLIVLSVKDTGTVQWQCKHPLDNNTFSNTVSITAKVNGNALTESVTCPQIPSPLNTTIIVSLGAVCAVLLLIIIVTFIIILIKLDKKQPVPSAPLQIPAEERYDDLGNTDSVDYQQLRIYENIKP